MKQYKVTFGNQSETYEIPVLAKDVEAAMKAAAKIDRKKFNPYGYVTKVQAKVNLAYKTEFSRVGGKPANKVLPRNIKPIRKPKRILKAEALVSDLLRKLEKNQSQQQLLVVEAAELHRQLTKLGHKG